MAIVQHELWLFLIETILEVNDIVDASNKNNKTSNVPKHHIFRVLLT